MFEFSYRDMGVSMHQICWAHDRTFHANDIVLEINEVLRSSVLILYRLEDTIEYLKNEKQDLIIFNPELDVVSPELLAKKSSFHNVYDFYTQCCMEGLDEILAKGSRNFRTPVILVFNHKRDVEKYGRVYADYIRRGGKMLMFEKRTVVPYTFTEYVRDMIGIDNF